MRVKFKSDPLVQSAGSSNGRQSGADPDAVLAAMVEAASKLGIDLVDMWGTLEALSLRFASQVNYVHGIDQISKANSESNERVAELAFLARTNANEADRVLSESKDDLSDSLIKIGSLASWVAKTSSDLVALKEELSMVTRAVASIDQIAQQTHILALNARIEAVRAGNFGSSFAVIANSIRDLADETIQMAASMGVKIKSANATIAAIENSATAARNDAVRTQESTHQIRDVIESVASAISIVDASVTEISEAAETSRNGAVELAGALESVVTEIDSSSADLGAIKEVSSNLLDQVEGLLQLGNTSKTTTADSNVIALAIATAQQMQQVMEAAIRAGTISESDFFDENYLLIEGTNPQQHLTRFVRFTDENFTPIQEKVLELDKRIVFCAGVDRNGYLPTHNLKFSKPQGNDPVWNAANSRNRRIFNDRTGLSAGRNRDRYLLQTYRRDMGGGRYALMKDVSAPIFINGRHFGGVRIGYSA
jgi:methyl-accepting chemotaxis protein